MNLGQVYTRKAVADYMVSLFDLPEGSRILDPCFGGGVFIDSLRARTGYSVAGIELDARAFDDVKDSHPEWGDLFNMDFFRHTVSTPYDGIIMNPPYIRQEEIDALVDSGISKTRLREACRRDDIPTQANMYVYFILYALLLLRDKGQLVVIFPNAWKNTPVGAYLRGAIAQTGYIEKDINVCGTPFEDNPIVDVCILKIVKGAVGPTIITSIETDGESIVEVDAVDQRPLYDSTYLCHLDCVAHIRRGLTTMCNEVFINPNVTHTDNLHDIISSPKSIPGMNTLAPRLDKVLVIPRDHNLSPSERTYLTEAAGKIKEAGSPVTLCRKILNGEAWFHLAPQPIAPVIFPYIVRYLPRFIKNDGGYMARDNFYLIYPDIDTDLLLALLNNHFVFAQLELCGKSYGNGVLKIQKYDVDKIKIVRPDILPYDIRARLCALARDYAHTASETCLDEITALLTPFYKVNGIVKTYSTLKTKRLQHAKKR